MTEPAAPARSVRANPSTCRRASTLPRWPAGHRPSTAVPRLPHQRFEADAHYKRGLALNGLGRLTEARAAFAVAASRYPTSDAGRLAKMALARAERLGAATDQAKPAASTQAEAKGFYLVLLLADTQPGAKLEGVSAREMNALNDAREFLPYKSYQVLDTVLVRGSRTQTVRLQGPAGAEYSGALVVGPTSPPSEQDVYLQIDLTDGRTSGSVLKTEFRIRLGETVVVGTSRVKGTEQALVLLLTALPTQEAFTPEEVYKPGHGVSAPVLVAPVKPGYTKETMAARIEGTVIVECIVLVDGSVGAARVIKSLDPALDAQAIIAARQWRFKPGMKEGRPVATQITIDLTFSVRK